MSKSAAAASSKKEPGDKVFVGGSPADRAVLLNDLIECIHQKAPKSLLITLSTLSEFLQQQPALSPSNLYRKQYGNLEHAMSVDAAFWSSVFTPPENGVVRLLSLEALQSAAAAGNLPQPLLAKCRAMHATKRAHDIDTMKTNNKNECTRCGQVFATLVNTDKACKGQTKHQPAHDFGQQEDPFDLG